MTNKRFTLKEIDCYNNGIQATDVILDNGIELPQSTACDILNKLVTVNEKISVSNDYLYKNYHKANSKIRSIEGILEENESKKYLSKEDCLNILNKIWDVIYEE